MTVVRRATAEDAEFLREMLAVAADWRPDAVVRPLEEVMAQPELAHYVDDWGRDGDVGFVARQEAPVGAAWWRFLPEDDPGYGFVEPMIPELAIGVRGSSRGQGVGTLLLEALLAEARRCSLPAVSLSVEPDNPAVRLYRRLGFVTVGGFDGSLTMLASLAE